MKFAFAAQRTRRYNRLMNERRDPLATTLILSGVLLMLVPCFLGVAALIIFGWPILAIR